MTLDDVIFNIHEDFYENIEYLKTYSIPLYYHPNYKYTIELDEKTYIFKIKWNHKFSFWTIGIYDNAETLICTTKLVPEWDPIKNYRYNKKLPKYLMYTTSTQKTNEYPTQFDVEENFELIITNIELYK